MRLRGAVAAAAALVVTSAGEIAAQDLLPPGQGWTSIGAGALIDSTASPVSSLMPGNRPCRVWVAGSRPFGVCGISYKELAVSLRAGKAVLTVTWRGLAGDGMRHMSAGAAITFPAAPRARGIVPAGRVPVLLTLGAGAEGLGAVGSAPLRTCLCRFGLIVVPGPGWRAGFLYRGAFGRRAVPVRSMHAISLGYEGIPFAVRMGGLRIEGRGVEPSVSLSLRVGPLRLDAGGWGSPPVPSAGLHVVAAGLRWSVEVRWVPDLGTTLLWSMSAPGGVER